MTSPHSNQKFGIEDVRSLQLRGTPIRVAPSGRPHYDTQQAWMRYRDDGRIYFCVWDDIEMDVEAGCWAGLGLMYFFQEASGLLFYDLVDHETNQLLRKSVPAFTTTPLIGSVMRFDNLVIKVVRLVSEDEIRVTGFDLGPFGAAPQRPAPNERHLNEVNFFVCTWVGPSPSQQQGGYAVLLYEKDGCSLTSIETGQLLFRETGHGPNPLLPLLQRELRFGPYKFFIHRNVTRGQYMRGHYQFEICVWRHRSHTRWEGHAVLRWSFHNAGFCSLTSCQTGERLVQKARMGGPLLPGWTAKLGNYKVEIQQDVSEDDYRLGQYTLNDPIQPPHQFLPTVSDEALEIPTLNAGPTAAAMYDGLPIDEFVARKQDQVKMFARRVEEAKTKHPDRLPKVLETLQEFADKCIADLRDARKSCDDADLVEEMRSLINDYKDVKKLLFNEGLDLDDDAA